MIELQKEQIIKLEGGRIVVAQVEPRCEQSPLLTNSDRDYLSNLISPTRQAQWSSCRHILRRELGTDAPLRYVGSGALILDRPSAGIAYISISHSSEFVAVMLCEKRCGVDIESLQRDFSRVASRYISAEERELFAQPVGPHFEAIMWGAKEALYKFGNQQGVDFIHDMVVTAIDPESQTLEAELYGVPTPTVHYLIVDNQILCYLVATNKQHT